MLEERHINKAPMFPLLSVVVVTAIVLAIATYPLYGAEYVTSLLGKFLCYSIFATGQVSR